MDSLPNDLERLIQPFLTVDQLIFVFNQNKEFCKNIKEAARRSDWSWILYYLKYYELQKSCIQQGYYGAIEIQNIGLMNDFENLNPEIRDDDRRIKYYLKFGIYLDELDITDPRYRWDALKALIKTHNIVGFKKYQQQYIEIFNSDYRSLLIYMKYAMKYNNQAFINILMPLVESDYRSHYDGFRYLCQAFLSKWTDRSDAYHIAHIYWIAKAGLIDICTQYIDTFSEDMVRGAIDGQHETILELIKDKHKDNIDLYRVLTKYYIKKNNFEQFNIYFKILMTLCYNKQDECVSLFEDAISSNNYGIFRAVSSFIRRHIVVRNASEIKDLRIAKFIAHNNKFGIYSYDYVVRELNEKGHNVAASIFAKGR